MKNTVYDNTQHDASNIDKFMCLTLALHIPSTSAQSVSPSAWPVPRVFMHLYCEHGKKSYRSIFCTPTWRACAFPSTVSPRTLLQQPIHSRHMNIGSVTHVMVIVSDKCFGPADIRQRVLEGSKIVDRKEEALSLIILSIRGDSLRGTRVLKGWVKCVCSMPVCS
jgi:hypothetical protein